MLALSTLHSLLSQALSLPDLHTAILLTPAGQLVSVASDPSRPKDEIRVVVGLSGEVWQETREQGLGMIDSELGRIVVLPVDLEELHEESHDLVPEESQPLMLLTLNSTDMIEWGELQAKGRLLASHLAKPLSMFREYLIVAKPLLGPPTSATISSPDRPTR